MVPQSQPVQVPAAPRAYADAPRRPEGPFDIRELVAREYATAIELEIGPGRGGFAFERLAADPSVAVIGLEVRRKWATLVDARLAKGGHSARARVYAEDSLDVLPRISPAASVSKIYLHFPDPWWKKRHQKRLVVGDKFTSHAARVLRVHGELYVQTDVAIRGKQYEFELGLCPFFDACGDTDGSARLKENPYNARSPREHRAIADGLPIVRLRYRRNMTPWNL